MWRQTHPGLRVSCLPPQRDAFNDVRCSERRRAVAVAVGASRGRRRWVVSAMQTSIRTNVIVELAPTPSEREILPRGRAAAVRLKGVSPADLFSRPVVHLAAK